MHQLREGIESRIFCCSPPFSLQVRYLRIFLSFNLTYPSTVLLVRRGHILATPKLLSHSHVSWESLSMHRAEVPLLLPLGLLCGLLFRAYTAFRNFLLGQLQQWRQQLEANGFFFASNLREVQFKLCICYANHFYFL